MGLFEDLSESIGASNDVRKAEDKAREKYAQYLELNERDREAFARSVIMENELRKSTIEELKKINQRLADQVANRSKK